MGFLRKSLKGEKEKGVGDEVLILILMTVVEREH